MDVSIGKMVLNGEQFLATPAKKREWLLKPLIPKKGIVNFYGKPKTGKSFAAFGVGLAIANGDPEWNGFPVETQANVLTLQIDTPEGELYERIESVKKGGYNMERMFFADMSIAPYPFNILVPQHSTWLEQQIKFSDAKLVIIDTLREAHEEDENDSKMMKKVINMLVKVAHANDAATILISHSRKDSQHNQMGAASDLMDEGRGSSYVSGRMDTIVRFTGKGKPTRGHMEYRGRAKDAQGKIPIEQDPDTGLMWTNQDHARLEAITMKVMKENAGLSVNAQAKLIIAEAKAAGIPTSMSTATRWIKKFTTLMDVKSSTA